MRILLPYLFDTLKQQILAKAGIKAITPGDCRFLSATISINTGKQISDTTLKRIFGFTLSKFSPSQYTLNIMAEYCGYDSWDIFCKQLHNDGAYQKQNVVGDETLSVISRSLNLSQKMLQALINRSVIPFNLTIKRELVSDHLNLFSQSSETATVLAAPAGYGKTTSICHWVEEQLSAISENGESVLVFLSSKVLSSHPKADSLNAWLHSLMGLESGLAKLLERDTFNGKQFYFVVDGFDKERFRPGEFELITDNLLDLIALYRNHANFKVILTMRSANWVSLRNRLLIENTLDDWFLGFMQDEAKETNMQLFNAKEINLFSNQIDPSSTEVIKPEVASLFSYPLFLQYYYQKHAQRFSLNCLDYFGIYDIISSYFFDKIYNTHLCTEKVILIKILLDNGKVDNGNFIVDELKVYAQIKEFSEVYNELLSIGFIKEVNRSTEVGFAKHIEFAHERLLAYTMARNLIYNNNGLYDYCLMELLNQEIDIAFRVPVLKWCIFNVIKARQFHVFKSITNVHLHAAEKAQLLKFLINLIQHKYLSIHQADPFKFSFCQEHQDVFHYFFGFEFISSEYEEVLHQLLTLDLEEASKVWVHTCLGIIGIVQLNTKLTENAITELSNMPASVLQSFQINPLLCIDAIYQYLKFGIVKREALAHITHFCFNPPQVTDQSTAYCSNHIIYLLAVSTLGIADNKRKLIRFIRVLDRCTAIVNQNSTFEFFLNVTKADSYFSLGEIDKGMAVHNKLCNDYTLHAYAYTPYMKVCLDLSSAKMLASTGSEYDAHLIVEKTMQTSANLKFRYIEAYILAAYLAMPDLDTSSADYKEINYKFLKLIRNAGLNPCSFLISKTSTFEIVR